MQEASSQVNHQEDEMRQLEELLQGRRRWFRFTSPLEREFLDHYAISFQRYRRIVILLAMVVILASGVLDFLLAPEAIYHIALVRYGAGGSLLALLFAFSRTRHFLFYQQTTLVAMLTIVALVLSYILALGDQLLFHIYSVGVVLIVVFTCALVRMLFASAFISTAIICSCYFLVLYFVNPQPLEVTIAYSIFLIGASLMGFLACFDQEQVTRYSFLQTRLLNLKQNLLETSNAHLQQMVAQDGLTGIANRRYFDTCISAEWNRAKRAEQPISLLMIDIDYFKHYNDAYGHQAGDDCLIVVASIIRDYAQRAGELAARYGGEEFVIILPNTNLDQAKSVGQQVCEEIERFAIPHSSSEISDILTASIGVSSCVPDVDDAFDMLIKVADEALYEAKHLGRNRVESKDMPNNR